MPLKVTLSHDDGHNEVAVKVFDSEEEGARYIHQFVSDSVPEILYCLKKDGFYMSEEGEDEFILSIDE